MRKLFYSVVLTALAVALSIVSVSASAIGPTP